MATAQTMAASKRTEVSSKGKMYSENISSDMTWVFPPDAKIALSVWGPGATVIGLSLAAQTTTPKRTAQRTLVPILRDMLERTMSSEGTSAFSNMITKIKSTMIAPA